MQLRFFIIFTVTVLVSGLYLAFFGRQTVCVLESRYLAWEIPLLREKPAELQDFSISNSSGKKLSYFGHEFQVPWDDLDESATKINSNRVLLSFRSGHKLMFYSGPPKEFVNTVLSSRKSDSDSLQQLFGKQAFDTDYAFIRIMLDTTPDKITLRTPVQDAVARSTMLTFKAIATSSADTGIFSVRTQDFKGFQYGNPLSKPKQVVVDLFSDDGCLEFKFFENDNKPINISQEDVNRVLQTARKVSSSTPRTNSSSSH